MHDSAGLPAGLQAIKRFGGTAIVQDPHEAEAPGMPRSACRHIAVDHRLPLESIAPTIAARVADPDGSPLVPSAAASIDASSDRAAAAAKLIRGQIAWPCTRVEIVPRPTRTDSAGAHIPLAGRVGRRPKVKIVDAPRAGRPRGPVDRPGRRS